jgi:hypothetical protein
MPKTKKTITEGDDPWTFGKRIVNPHISIQLKGSDF